MISTRRDLYLILISYSNQKEVMDLQDLARFLENEQKVRQNVKESFHWWLGWAVFSAEGNPECTHLVYWFVTFLLLTATLILLMVFN